MLSTLRYLISTQGLRFPGGTHTKGNAVLKRNPKNPDGPFMVQKAAVSFPVPVF